MNKYSGKIGIVVTASLLSFVLASPAHAWDWFKGDKGEQGEVGQQGPQGQKGDDGFGTQADLDNVNARIEQVNLEDMRTNSGVVSGDNLTLRVEDQAKTQGRNTIYGKDVVIDVSGLNQSDEVATNANHIKTNKDRIEQVDQEDHRAVGGSYDSGKLTINTEDMDGGSKRTFEITGLDAESKANTTAISNVNNRVTTNTTNISLANQRIDNVMSDMKYMDRNLSAGIASSISIGQHQFDPSFKGGQVSLSGGFYNGENAVSFAVGVPVGERAFFSASIAADSGSYGESGGVGLTFQLPK